MAIAIGMHTHYILYKLFCNVAHISSMGTTNFFTIKEGTIVFLADTDEEINTRWYTACAYLQIIMMLVNETFDLKINDRLGELHKILTSRKDVLKACLGPVI
jgi:hypothetical protein